jgi:hypothetical protein
MNGARTPAYGRSTARAKESRWVAGYYAVFFDVDNAASRAIGEVATREA